MSLHHNKIIRDNLYKCCALLMYNSLKTSRSTTKFSQPKLKETYGSQLGELTFQFLFFVKVTAWQVEIKA